MAFAAAFGLVILRGTTNITAQNAAPDVQALRSEIDSLLRDGNIDAAVDKARLAAHRNPYSAAIEQLLGIVLYKKGLNDDARAALRRAIQIDPTIPQYYFQLAQVNFSDHRYANAATRLETFLRLNPNNAEAHVLLGQSYQNLNQPGPAIVHYKRALALSPVLDLIHYRLGLAYQTQGQMQDAIEEFKKEIASNPQNYDPYWHAGEIEFNQGDLDAAKEFFQDGVGVSPQGVPARYGLGRVLLAQKQIEPAATEFKKVIESNPDYAHCSLAQAYQQMGKKQDARIEFDRCGKKSPRRSKTQTAIAGQNP